MAKVKKTKNTKKAVRATQKKKPTRARAVKKAHRTNSSRKVTMKGTKSTNPLGLAVGDTAPAIALAATGGKTISLTELKGKKVVLYFYPKDATPGCTVEGHEFTRLRDQFDSKNTVVLGVSRDTVESHEKFRAQENYSIDLLSDADESLCSAFGVMKDKNMYGKKVRGIERSTFIIDENGRVIKEWRGVKAEGHAAEVLNYIENL